MSEERAQTGWPDPLNLQRNLAEKAECQELVRFFTEELNRFQKQTQDPWIHKWTFE